VDGAVGEAWQHVGQIFANGHVQFAAALDDREDGGDLRAGFLASQMQQFFLPIAIGLIEFSASSSITRSQDDS